MVYRLKKNSAFKNVFDNGNFHADGRLTLYILRNGTRNNYYGVSAGKKIGKSVYRNRVKRQIKAAIRNNARLVKPGHDIVVLARPGIKGEPFDMIEKSFVRLIKKGRVYAGEPA